MVCAEIVPNIRFNNLKIGGPCDGIYFSANKKNPSNSQHCQVIQRRSDSTRKRGDFKRVSRSSLVSASNMAGRPPIRNSCKSLFIILEILKFLNYSYFFQIMTRKLKIGNLTNTTELYPLVASALW